MPAVRVQLFTKQRTSCDVIDSIERCEYNDSELALKSNSNNRGA